MKSRKRLMELAGIKTSEDENLEEEIIGAEDYFGMNDDVELDGIVQGFKSLNQQAEESDEDVESFKSINDRADNLYPGHRYKCMYSGEHMMESVNYIELISDRDTLELPDELF